MTKEEAVSQLTNFILTNHQLGKSLWHISLSNDVVASAKSIKLGIYQDAKAVFDDLKDNPSRSFESVTEIAEENNPTTVSVWAT